MRQLTVFLAILVVGLSLTSTQRSPRPTLPPVLGTWQFMGTAPPGFVRAGLQVGRITVVMRHGHLSALVITGRHRYAASAQYIPSRHEVRLTVRTVKGIVRLDATLWHGNKRMLGTWYDTHGDDGGFVLVRVNVKPHRVSSRR